MKVILTILAVWFQAPASGDPSKRSKTAFLFHHGHSDCVCDPPAGTDPAAPKQMVWMACRPGCNSSMPSLAELEMPGYSWWDLYNTSGFIHGLGADAFILSMPLKGVNYGLGYDHDGRLVKNETGGGQVDHWCVLIAIRDVKRAVFLESTDGWAPRVCL